MSTVEAVMFALRSVRLPTILNHAKWTYNVINKVYFNTSEEIKENKHLVKGLKGVFPVYKDETVTSQQVANYIKLQLEDDLRFPLLRIGLKIGVKCILEDLAKGVLLINIGEKSHYLVNEALEKGMRYNATICLGKQTSTLYRDGVITDEKPYDHVTLDQLKEASQQFLGDIQQKPWGLPYVRERKQDDGQEPVWKSTCYSIEFTDFKLPYVSLQIHSDKLFHVSCFLQDLAKAVHTCAYVTELERTHYGPFTCEDAVPSYFWGLKYFKEAIMASRAKLKALREEGKNVKQAVN